MAMANKKTSNTKTFRDTNLVCPLQFYNKDRQTQSVSASVAMITILITMIITLIPLVMMPGCVWSRSHLPAAAPRSPARKYISIFSIIFYIWHHLQPRRGDGDTSFTHNRGRVEVEGSPCKAASVAVVRWPGPCRRVCPASSWRW